MRQVGSRSSTRAVNRVLPLLGDRPVDGITPADVAGLVAKLAAEGKARESIRKSVTALAMVLDFAGVTPNPARDRVTVKLPREEPEEPNPPAAADVETVYRLLPSKHRLAFLFLDHSGARVSAIDKTLVGDYDESRRRVRLRAATTKTRRALWIELPEALADALEAELGPREDRNPDGRLFPRSGADALRTAIAKAGRRDPALVAARPAAPADLAAPPARRAVGSDRRVRRPAEPRRDGEHLHPRPDRRGRARLRAAARLTPPSDGLLEG
jgi:hypothetical protein